MCDPSLLVESRSAAKTSGAQRKSVCQNQLLKQHIARDVPVRCAVTAARNLLAIVALEVGVHLLVPSDLFGRSRMRSPTVTR